MSVRLRRLMADYEKIKDEFTGHKYIKVEPIGGNPPEKYLVTYYVKGLKIDEKTKRPVEINFHQVEIYLHKDYPREKPKAVMRTEIFHPNFGPYVCIGDHWAAGETLVDVIIQIGNMIQYREYNIKSPLNAIAAKWTKENENLLPVGKVDLYQPEPDIEIEDIDITFLESKEDDLEIELK
jgi:ubiquitin-protein ligase